MARNGTWKARVSRKACVMNDPAALIHSFIQAAVALNASDIHIEPQASHCRVRFRVNGLLIEKTTLPTWLGERLMTHIKLITQLNIAEKRLPQDGHFHDPTVNLDIRVSTCPQTNGEKIVTQYDMYTVGEDRLATYTSHPIIGLISAARHSL